MRKKERSRAEGKGQHEGEGWKGGKSTSDSYNGAGTCHSANYILFCPHRPAQYSRDQFGPCSFGLSKQGPGFLQLPLSIWDKQWVEVTPKQACSNVSFLGEGATYSPGVPGGAGFGSICHAIGEIPSQPRCPVGLGAGSAHVLGLEEIGLWGRGRQFPLFTCSLVTHTQQSSAGTCLLSPLILRHPRGLG